MKKQWYALKAEKQYPFIIINSENNIDNWNISTGENNNENNTTSDQ